MADIDEANIKALAEMQRLNRSLPQVQRDAIERVKHQLRFLVDSYGFIGLAAMTLLQQELTVEGVHAKVKQQAEDIRSRG